MIVLSRYLEYIIPDSYDGKKVVHFLRGEKKFSCRLVSVLKQIPDGIQLNGSHIRTIDRIKAGDILSVNIPDDKNEIEPTDFPLDIVYEDDDIMVVNKPAGLAVHPTHNHQGDTLANAAAGYLKNKDKNVSFRAVGRLDKQTSGLVLLAMNKYAAAFLPDKDEKEYLAVAGGYFDSPGTINKRIYRPDPMKSLRAVSDGNIGDEAVTHYTPVSSDGKRTLVCVTLETGRTHQIRVHFSSIGAPLAGDEMYSSTDFSINRAALHCGKLTLIHPVTNEEMTFTAPMPEDMNALLNNHDSPFVPVKIKI